MRIAGSFLRALSDASGLVGPATACAGCILPCEHAADSANLAAAGAAGAAGAAAPAGRPSTSVAKPASLACDSSLASDHECTFDAPLAKTWRPAASTTGAGDENVESNLGYTFVWMGDVRVAQSNGVDGCVSPKAPSTC
ncbi:hypothetical protein ACFPTX_00525 [Pseudomonas sp. GCM10022188]|uniref:hypothetical protein n=1 Tax=Pseudomonas TaxID=286 RepID=UPI001E3A1A59|nr:hypothetical protein [Pseudomonas oryzagri]MCC6075090.1 hypothetical protein [Pseudomonas oryzagri]